LTTSAIMLQGTGSDVGKSLLVTGLCRAFAKRGRKVRPFKPQNMSNNAAVTADGGEIGRAQALQARACGVPMTRDMNPILLKPQSEIGAQVVVHGCVRGNARAADYHALKPELLARVLESFDRLSDEADLIVVEGAGSPAEVNLRAGDIANMGFAEAAAVPVVLVGDIERGGVIAQLVGTWDLLDEADRGWLKGTIVNKFRGDPTLFESGLTVIEDRTGLPCFGVVPHFSAARRLPAEDAVAVDSYRAETDRPIRIAVPVLPRIANFDDLDPLIAEPDVSVELVRAGTALPGDADLVILPGSKSTLADLAALRAEGWDIDILAHHRRGGAVLGICGGYQMLGRSVGDPDGIEGAPGDAPGLGLLDIETKLSARKNLAETHGVECASGRPIAGYHMHMGQTDGPDRKSPMLRFSDADDGAVSQDGLTQGCYLHGLFSADEFRHAFLDRLKRRDHSSVAYEQDVEQTLDALAGHLESHLDVDRLLEIAHAR
jgi:adenosylcobyric acid synthase